MKTLFKILLGLIGLVLVAVIALAITLSNVDPNEHKDLISNRFEQTTGRSLSLAGDIAITIYPWLGVEVNDVTIGNAAGFGEQSFLHTDYAKLRIKLLPILHEQYEIDTIQVHGAVINLAKNKEGITNWQDLAGGEKQESESSFPLAALVLGGVDIKNASIHWSDQSTGVRYDLSNINASTGDLIFGEPIELKLQLDAKANKPALSANIDLSGTLAYDTNGEKYTVSPLQLNSKITGDNIPGGATDLAMSAVIDVDMENETANINNLQFNALNTRITGTIAASNITSSAPSAQTELTIEGDDLALLFKVAEIEPLATQLADINDRQFKLSTSVTADVSRGDIDVSNLDINLLGASVQGDLKANNIQSDTPGFKGALTASGPDLPTLMQVIGQFQKGEKTLANYGKQLRKVSARAFTVATTFDADLKSGDIDVPSLSINTLGIKIDGSLKAKDMQGSKGSAQGNLHVSSKNLPELLTALDQKDLAEVMKTLEINAGISGTPDNINLKPVTIKTTIASKDIPNSPVDLILQADSRINLEKEQLQLDHFSLTGLGLNLTGSVTANKINTEPEASGNINLAQFNLKKFLKQMNQDVPKMAGKNALEKVALNASFNGSAKQLAIPQLSLVLDNTNLSGNFSVSDFENPAIQAAINIDQINLDDYLPPVEKNKKGKPVTPETAAGAAAELPIETLRALNLKTDLKIGNLVVSNAKLSQVVVSLNAKDGKIKLTPVSANLYKGSYKGDILLDASGKLPKLTINSNLKGVQLEPLLTDVSGEAMLHGSANINLALVGLGNNSDAIKRSISGIGELKVEDGVLMGVDVNKVLEQAEIIIESKRLGKFDKGTETKFEQLTATLNINSGIVTNDDLILKSPGFKVTGKGTAANLRNETIKYDLLAVKEETRAQRDDKAFNLGGYQIPVRCRGKLEAPDCQPDYGELLKEVIRKAGTEKIGEFLNKALGGKKPSGGTDSSTEQKPKLEDALKKGLKGLFD